MLLHFKGLGESKVFGGVLIKPVVQPDPVLLEHRPGQFSTVAGQFNPQ